MRHLPVLVLVLVACGSTATNNNPDAKGSNGSGSNGSGSNGSGSGSGSDEGSYDFGCGSGSACKLDDVCCVTPGGSATAFACVAPASCPSGDQLNCDGPDECAGTSTPVCCGVDVDNGTGQYPSCGVSSIGTSCKTSAECPTHLATSCTDTTTVVLCHEKADCSDPNNPVCCTFTEKTATITFCIDQNTANAAGATCHP
jgi:hypothetical protein